MKTQTTAYRVKEEKMRGITTFLEEKLFKSNIKKNKSLKRLYYDWNVSFVQNKKKELQKASMWGKWRFWECMFDPLYPLYPDEVNPTLNVALRYFLIQINLIATFRKFHLRVWKISKLYQNISLTYTTFFVKLKASKSTKKRCSFL